MYCWRHVQTSTATAPERLGASMNTDASAVASASPPWNSPACASAFRALSCTSCFHPRCVTSRHAACCAWSSSIPHFWYVGASRSPVLRSMASRARDRTTLSISSSVIAGYFARAAARHCPVSDVTDPTPGAQPSSGTTKSARSLRPGEALCSALAASRRKFSSHAGAVWNESVYPSSSAILNPATPGCRPRSASRCTPASKLSFPRHQRFARSASIHTCRPR